MNIEFSSVHLAKSEHVWYEFNDLSIIGNEFCKFLPKIENKVNEAMERKTGIASGNDSHSAWQVSGQPVKVFRTRFNRTL